MTHSGEEKQSLTHTSEDMGSGPVCKIKVVCPGVIPGITGDLKTKAIFPYFQ